MTLQTVEEHFLLFHRIGLIKLKDPTDLHATAFDIVENPKKLKFKQLEAAQLLE